MRSIVLISAAALLVFAAAPTLAEETPAVAEIYACMYVDGKGWDDAVAANEQYKAALASVGIEIDSFAWRPLRGTPGPDLVWSSNWENLNAMAAGLAKYSASKEGQAADARWNTVLRCQESVSYQERLYEPKELPDIEGDYVIEVYGCTLNAGKDAGDLAAVEADWKAFITKNDAGTMTFRRVPFIGNPPFEHAYFMVHEDIQSYAATTTAYLTADGQAALQAKIDATQSCNSFLMAGKQMTSAD